ncbi:MAG: hypothetical protein BMS9Abin33_0737 [Gammaproteobacteria bacterium]|nr:MAG: hypothetical protein BMS9Abin33_0737 [Gammaproteobacteria bacterium]
MLQKLAAVIVLVFMFNSVYADSLDVNFSSDSVRAVYNLDRGSKDYGFGGLVVNPDRGSSSRLVHAGLEVTGDDYSGNTTLEGKLGFRAYLLSSDAIDVSALALGGQIRFYPEASKVGFSISGYYAPEIVVGLDGDRFWEWGARLEYRLFETGTLYAGYREIEARPDGVQQDVTIDDGGFIGVDIRF